MRRAPGVATVLVAGLALATAVAMGSGLVLWDRYRPAAPGASDPDVGPVVVDSRSWDDRHRVALLAGVALVALVVLAVGSRLARRPGVRTGVALALGFVALGVAVAAVVTHPMVTWDQLALRSVTRSDGVQGWGAVLDDEVRFALVDDVEVAPSEYRVVVAVHLAAPVLALAVAAGAVGLSRRRPAPAPIG